MNENRLHLPDPKRMAALIVVILAGALISLNACTPSLPGTGGNTPMPDTSQPATGKPAENYGVDVGVSQGQAQAQTPVPQPVATGEPLTPQEIEAIFERLPDLPVSPNEQTEFQVSGPIAAAAASRHDHHGELSRRSSRLPPPRLSFPVRWRCCAMPRKGRSRSRRSSPSPSTSRWCRSGPWATWLRKESR